MTDDGMLDRLREKEAALEAAQSRIIELEAQLALTRQPPVTDSHAQMESRIEMILAHSLDCIVLTDTDFKIQQTNPAFRTLFHLSDDECLEDSLFDLIHPDDRERVETVLQSGIAERTDKRLETQLVWKDHVVIDVELSMDYIHAHTTESPGLICVMRDITQYKQNQKALNEERNLLRTLIDTIPDFIYIKDTRHRFLLSNVAHAEARGHSTPDDLIGKTDFDFFSPELAKQFMADEVEVMRTGTPMLNYEEQSMGIGGEVMWASSSKVPLYNMDGEIIGLVGITRDITDSKAIENALLLEQEKLYESQQMLQTVLDTIPVRVFWKDRHGIYQGCNRLYAQDAGLFSPSDIVGKRDGDLPWTDDETAVYLAADEAVMTRGVPKLNYEASKHTAIGEHLIVQANKLPMRDFQGRVVGILGTYMDITGRKQAEDQLRRYAREIEDLYNNAPCGYHSIDGQGVYLRINDTELKWLGYTREEVVGKLRISDILTPESQKLIAVNFPIVKERGHVSNLELEFIRKDGSILPVLASGTAIWNENGEFAMSRSILFDMTERKQIDDALRHSEQQLRESRRMLQTVLDTIPVGVFWKDKESVYQGCNRQYALDAGLGSPATIVGKRDTDIWPKAKAAEYLSSDRGILSNNITRSVFENSRINAAGNLMWVAVTKVPLVNPEGEIIGILGAYMDISDRKQAEDALRENEERLRILFAAMPDAILLITAKGVMADVNPAALRLTGLPREQLIGKHFSELEGVLLSDHWGHIQESLSQDKTELGQMDCRIQHNDGTLHSIEVLFHPVRIRGERYNLGIARDMTLHKRYEETLERALEQERELGQLKSRFLSIASHEFRNPLAVIMSSADMVIRYRDRMSDVEMNDRLEKIRGQVAHLKSIIEDVLELEGLQQGRIHFNPEKGNLDALCRDIVEEFSTSPGQTHELRYTGPETPIITIFDLRLMRQVVTNLISNAIKYSPGKDVIWINLWYDDAAHQLVLKVRDEGIGIPADTMKYLFDAFFRADNVGKIPGNGLGLSIIKQAMDWHGGSVIAESEIGLGATFTVTLPLE
ncbi:MAG: PAS domain S-box protein [Anaerolineaceae bacterium]|nr:PAS domain S-box protein [Anaerolineaceae bacterium]